MWHCLVHVSYVRELLFLYPEVDYTLRGNIVIEHIKRQMYKIIIVFHEESYMVGTKQTGGG